MKLRRLSKKLFKYLAAAGCLLLLFGGILLSAYKQPSKVSAYAAEGGVEDFVSRLYTVILERTPDEAGLAEWTRYLKDGTFTGTEVAKGFIMSKEFLNKDMEHEEFVQILYSAFFGREADPEGLAGWVDYLDRGYRKSYIFAGFANSTEFDALCDSYEVEAGSVPVTVSEQQPNLTEEEYNTWLFVERMYTEVLTRTPAVQEIKDWAGYLQDGSFTGAEVASGFILSKEFQTKPMTNEAYVKIMYKAFFGREADAEGLAGWVNALDSAEYSKEFVFAGFANSGEFGTLCKNYGIMQGEVEVPEVTPTPEPEEPVTIPASGIQTVALSDGGFATLEFDRNGRMIAQSLYDADGTLVEQYDCIWEEDVEFVCLILERTSDGCYVAEFDWYVAGTLERKNIDGTQGGFAYLELISENQDGTVTVCYRAVEDGYSCYEDYYENGVLAFYDLMENGKTIKTISYAETGEVEYWYGYEYYDSGTQKRKEYYLSEGTEKPSYIYEYYENGQALREENYKYDKESGIIQSADAKLYHEDGTMHTNTTHYYTATGDLDYSMVTKYENAKVVLREYYTSEGNIDYWYGYEYYDNGATKKEMYYFGEGTDKPSYVYEYDENGNKIYEKKAWYTEDEELDYYEVTTYANKNVLSKIRYTADDEVDYWYGYEYYDNGATKKEMYYFGEGTDKPSYVYEYDENGNKIYEKKAWYTEDEELDYYTVITYASGRILRKIRYNAEDTVNEWYGYEYYDNGRKKKEMHYYGEGTKNPHYVYEYDEEGEKIRITNGFFYAGGALDYYEVTEYEKGEVVSKFTYTAEGAVKEWYVCEYYENGILKSQRYYYGEGTDKPTYIYEGYENGSPSRVEKYNYDSERVALLSSVITSYDEDGKKTEKNNYYHYTEDGLLKSYLIQEYEDEKILWETGYTADGAIEHWSSYEYYETGTLKKDVHYYGEGTDKPKAIYEYYENGNHSRWEAYSYHEENGGITSSYVYLFDEAGNRTHATESNYVYTKDGVLSYYQTNVYVNEEQATYEKFDGAGLPVLYEEYAEGALVRQITYKYGLENLIRTFTENEIQTEYARLERIAKAVAAGTMDNTIAKEETGMVEEIIAAYQRMIREEMTDFEKILAVHDYVVLHTEYDRKNRGKYNAPENEYEIEGVFLDGKALDEGYSEAVKVLLDAAGVENKIADSGNLVKLDGQWYYMDAARDEASYQTNSFHPIGMLEYYCIYDYFCVVEGKYIDLSVYPELAETAYNASLAHTAYCYGENGYLTQYVAFCENGDVSTLGLVENSEAGLKQAVTEYRGKRYFTKNRYLEYDDAENLETETGYDTEEAIRYVRSYGNAESTTVWYENEAAIAYDVCQYNADGTVKEMVSYTVDDVVTGRELYNEDGRITKKTLYTSDETVEKELTYAYDTEGLRTSKEAYDTTGACLFTWEYEDTESAGNEYVYLYSAADFAKLAEQPGGKYALGADIDMRYADKVPYGEYGYVYVNVDFSGVLDGNNYSLTGVDAMLFRTITESGVVKNLDVEADYSRSDDYYLKVLAVENYGIVQNCTADVFVQDKEEFAMAGLVWENYHVMKDCRAYYEVQTHAGCMNSFAGITLSNNYGSAVQNCKVYGQVEGLGAIHGGGISSSSYGEIVKSDSYLNVNATIGQPGFYGPAEFGGIVGMACGRIAECRNYGEFVISNMGFDDALGGIAGAASGAVIMSCENYGDIEVQVETYPRTKIAGVLGEGTDRNTLLDCINTGYITGLPENSIFYGVFGSATVMGTFDENDQFIAAETKVYIDGCISESSNKAYESVLLNKEADWYEKRADILKTKQIVCAPGTVITPEVLDNSKMLFWDMGRSISLLEGSSFTAGQYDTYLIAYAEDGTFDICFVDVEEGAETEYFEEYLSVKVR